MEKKEKQKKRGGCLRVLIKGILVLILFSAAAVFIGYRYLRPFLVERTSAFEPEIFGFELPEGFSSRSLPVPPIAGDYNVAVLSAAGEASHVMDRISLSAVRGGWKPEEINLGAIDFNMEKIKGIDGDTASPADKMFFRKGEKFLFISAFSVRKTVYLATATGDMLKLSLNEKNN